jgi:uncharacterized protein (TIGR02466 family)
MQFDINNLTVEATEAVALFPTYVWCIQLKREDYQLINEKVKNKLMDLIADKPRLNSGEKWQSEQDLHTLEEFQDLNVFIHGAVKAVLGHLKVIYENYEITGCWANISAPHAQHEAHFHPNNYLSGVYYVQTQEGADNITFIDPRKEAHLISPQTVEDTPQNTGKMRLRVTDGSLVIFPAWLIHSVQPNMSDKERISVSFNIMFTSFSESVSKPKWQGNVQSR